MVRLVRDEQLDAKLVLNLLDLEADRSRRQPKLIRSAGEVEMFSRRHQCPQSASAWYKSHFIFKKKLLIGKELLVSPFLVNVL